MLEPLDGAEVPVKTEAAIMDQAGYDFLPEFLIAQAGQLVQFRNSEDVLHNVRLTDVSSQKPVFNVATLAFGKYEHKLEPGFYNVTCDIHSTMRASILVTASPYAASTVRRRQLQHQPSQTRAIQPDGLYRGLRRSYGRSRSKPAATDLGVIQ